MAGKLKTTVVYKLVDESTTPPTVWSEHALNFPNQDMEDVLVIQKHLNAVFTGLNAEGFALLQKK